MTLTPLPHAPSQKRDEAVSAVGQPRQQRAGPAFNAEATLDRLEGNRDLLGRMVGLFGMQWRRLWTEVAQAAEYHDGPRLELTANKLKQSLASFGANEASRVAQELEERGRKSQFHHVEQSCARLKLEIERLVAALQVFAEENCG